MAGYCGAFAALGLAEAALGPTLPALAEQTRTGLSEISFLFMARALGYLMGAFLAGRLYDQLPGHPVMGTVLFVMVLAMVFIPLTPWLVGLSLILLLLGIAQSTVDVGGNTLLVWVYRSEVGPFMNGLHFFFGVGAFLAPVIVAQTTAISDDITWAYWLLALLIGPVAVWLLRLSSPSAPPETEDEALIAHGVEPSSPPVQPGPAKLSTSNARRRILIALLAVFFFLFVGAEISFGGWIFSYAVTLELATDSTAAYLTSAFWGSLTVARLLAIPIAARYTPRTILFVDLGGCLASIALILAWPNSLTAIWLGTLGAGFSLASVFPTAISLAERHLRVTGQVTSWFIVGASLGSMFLPWLIGQLFESVGPRVMMLAIFFDMFLAVGLFAILITYANRSGPADLKAGD